MLDRQPVVAYCATNVAASDGSELKARPSPGESSVVADGGVVSSVNVWIDDQSVDRFPAASCARTRQRYVPSGTLGVQVAPAGLARLAVVLLATTFVHVASLQSWKESVPVSAGSTSLKLAVSCGDATRVAAAGAVSVGMFGGTVSTVKLATVDQSDGGLPAMLSCALACQ